VLLGGVLAFAGYRAWQIPNRDNYALFASALLLFVLIYCVSVMNLRIGGSGLTVEQAETVKKEIYAAKDDVAKIAESTLKTALVLADGSSRFGGMPGEHKEQIEQYFKSLGKYSGMNYEKALSEANQDVANIQRKLDERIKKSKHEKIPSQE
jgi:hypothetical protein